MSKVRCAICKEEIDASKAYWCPECSMWLCYKDTDRGFLGISIPKCPHGHEVKKK